MNRLIIIFVWLLIAPDLLIAETRYTPVLLEHDTDCTSLINGFEKDFCYEKDDQVLLKCVPDEEEEVEEIICDTPSEWVQVVGDLGGVSGVTTLADLTDVGATTAGNGRLIIADANSWESQAVSGDIVIDQNGTTTIQNNSVDGTDIAIGSDAQGDILYYNGTDWTRLGAGTSGQFLQTGGPSANPSWDTPDMPDFEDANGVPTLEVTTISPEGLKKNNTNMGNGHSIITCGTRQFAAYWNDDLKAETAKRTKTDGVWGAWTTYVMDGTGGRPNISLDDNDNHDSITIACDNDGIIHMAYNMHAEPIKYRRSTSANSVANFGSTLSMLGTNESQMTYATFIKDNNGELYYRFRDGGSGNGDYYLYKYTVATTSWAAAPGTSTGGKFINGKTSIADDSSTGVSPYISYPFVDENNDAHMIWTWRDSTGADSSHDVCYVKYDFDTGAFTKSSGSSQTIPITTANEEEIHDIPVNSGLVDTHTRLLVAKSSTGIIYAAYMKNNTAGYTQLYVNKLSSGTWTPQVITNVPTPPRNDSYDSQAYLGALLIDDNDYLYAIYQNTYVTSGIGVSESRDNGVTWKHSSLGSDWPNWRMNMDYAAWKNDNILFALIQYVPDVTIASTQPRPIEMLHWIPAEGARLRQQYIRGLYNDGDIDIKSIRGKIRFIEGFRTNGAYDPGNYTEFSWPFTSGVFGNALTIEGPTTGRAGLNLRWNTTPSSAGGGVLTLLSSDNTTALTSGARIGSINWAGTKATSSNIHALRILGFTSAAWTNTSTPAYLSFWTTPSGSTTTLERMRIAADGNVGIGTTNPTEKLYVSGNIHATGNITCSGTCGSGGGGGGGASAMSDLTDVGDTTATSGNLMIADGGSWESVPVTGDATLSEAGVITIDASFLQLTGDTLEDDLEINGELTLAENNNLKVIGPSGSVSLQAGSNVSTDRSYDFLNSSDGYFAIMNGGTLSGGGALTDSGCVEYDKDTHQLVVGDLPCPNSTGGDVNGPSSTSNDKPLAFWDDTSGTLLGTAPGLRVVGGDTLEADGIIYAAGFASTTTTENIGWSRVEAANQACTTTCTYAAVDGFDFGTSQPVSVSDATADSCLCAGPN